MPHMRHRSALLAGLAIAMPSPVAAEVSACDALHVVASVILPAAGDGGASPAARPPRESSPETLRLVASAHRMVDVIAADSALPAPTIARYRAVLRSRASVTGYTDWPETTLDAAEREALQQWLRRCADDNSLRPDPGGRRDGAATVLESSTAETAERRRATSERSIHDSGASIRMKPSWLTLSALATILALMATVLRWHAQWRQRRKRRARRYRCNLRATFAASDGTDEVRVEDISQLGCMLRTDRPVPPKTACHVHLIGTWIRGRVVWSNKRYTGIQFSRSMRRDFVRAVVRGDARPPRDRPALAGARQA